MNRIDNAFKNNKKSLIPFITCGHLSNKDTVELVKSMELAGADIIEIGVPYSDPLADGDVIQASYFKALRKGNKLKDVFQCIELIRNESEIPLVLMVYYNVVFCHGVENFIKTASQLGVDGIIVPDIPLEEREELMNICEGNSVYLIPLVAPTSKERIEKITKGAKGFVYCVSSNGTTGERNTLNNSIHDYLNHVKETTKVPICVGFGISSGEVVREIKDYCNGIIVGSAVVKRMDQGKDSVVEFLEELKSNL